MQDFKASLARLGLKEHLLTAISYLIPVVCGSGFLIAIGMAMGGSGSADLLGEYTFWDALAVLGAQGLGLLPMVVSTGIAFSIAGKPGIAPGIVIGMASSAVGAGFLGGLIGGYVAGYLAAAVIKYVKVPDWAKALMPMLIVPFVASLIGGLFMVYVIGAPISALTGWLTDYLNGLGDTSLLLYGALIGVLASVDYGGPINKTVFAFVLTLQAQSVNLPITALIVVNTATPLGFALAHFVAKLFRKKIYTPVEAETLKSAFPMGLIEIVEGVLPIVLNDIVRCVVATGIGGAVGGAISMVLGASASVPFGGFVALPAMENGWAFVVAVVANAVVTALALTVLKKDIRKKVEDAPVEEPDILDAEIEIF